MQRKQYRLLILPATLAVAAGGLAISPASAAPDDIRVLTTTTEYAGHPLGIDAPHPRLSWQLGAADRNRSQSAYEVRVASSSAKLAHPDVWDSGRVASNQSVLVPYAGPAHGRGAHRGLTSLPKDRGPPGYNNRMGPPMPGSEGGVAAVDR